MTLPKHKKQRMKIECVSESPVCSCCSANSDSLLLTVLTKPAGIAILYVAAKLWNVVQPEDAEIE
jgi:hypothetical protein